MSLPSDAKARKEIPVTTGVLDYFPLAIAAIARVSKAGNDQHNPGQPLHWARDKSTDHADCIGRHLLQRGTVDTDGMSHSAKMAWRALALLQLEEEGKQPIICLILRVDGKVDEVPVPRGGYLRLASNESFRLKDSEISSAITNSEANQRYIKVG